MLLEFCEIVAVSNGKWKLKWWKEGATVRPNLFFSIVN